MCRLLAYSGPALPLAATVCKPEHSLFVQSYAPQEMTSGVVNADGFGFSWYDKGEGNEPFIYRSTLPIWNDPNLESLGRYIRTTCLLGYVRSATAGQALDMSNTQPFVYGDWTFIHNGFIDGFRDPDGRAFARKVQQDLPAKILDGLAGSTDSELIFAWIVAKMDKSGELHSALIDAIGELADLLENRPARLCFIISNGRQTAAVRHAIGAAAPTLYRLEHGSRYPDAILFASEPLYEDPGWTLMEEGSLVITGPTVGDTGNVWRIEA
jgi:ergothioneine biosynthesis protein EgtC